MLIVWKKVTGRDNLIYKILELNIGNPSFQRAQRQCAWMKVKDYDIYVLTETRNSDGCNYISAYMESLGYQVIFPKPNGKNLGVMILSKIYLEKIDFLLNPNDELYGRFIKCHIAEGKYQFDLVGMYVPSRDRTYEKVLRKKRFCNIILDELKNNGYNLVLCGDYNVISIDHVPHYSAYFQWEYQFLQELSNMHLIDIYELLHPNTQEYSWKGRTGNGYRYDYIHIGRSIIDRVNTCCYIHETREGEQKITEFIQNNKK